ncbi:MAG: aminotransferase class I/II-fold pyridoxal phosphate-dependent enzyme [Arenicella sp.]|nr:aminotransferase class I/II-fold pyridoxal phosphate-dependent enzyme [Arenicella sp.]
MKKSNPPRGMGTLVNHVGEHHHHLRAHVMPIYQTTTFGFDDVASAIDTFTFKDSESFVYTRGRNPNSLHLADKIAYLEGLDLINAEPGKDPKMLSDAYVTASGMAAITAAVLSRMKTGDTALVQTSIYGGTHKFWSEIAPRYGITAKFISSFDPQAWQDAFREVPDANVVYIESPSNPTIDIHDIQALADVAHEHDAWLIVDNTFATPFHQRPLSLGADLVVHSSTKFLGGHGVTTGGIVVSCHAEFVNFFGELGQLASELGATPSPQDSWMINIGLKTLEIRMQRHASNAMAIAEHLSAHAKVKTVLYPGLPDNPYHELAKRQMHNGFGGLVSFEVKGGIPAAHKLLDELQIPSIAISLGSTDSLIQNPATMTHGSMPKADREVAGITDGLVRYHVGIENIEDLLSDLEQALELL